MMSAMKNMRPTCEQLIKKKKLWGLELSVVEKDAVFKKLTESSIRHSIEQSFCNFFIQTKLLHK